MSHKMFKRSVLSLITVIAVPLLVQAKQSPPENRVPIEAARKVAISTYSGKIQGEELEFEGGKWIYSFDMKSPKDSRVHEIHVDAISGKLLGKHTETAADERKEKREDANESDAE